MMKLYLGIDVSKGYADFVLLNEKREVVEPVFQLDDTAAGHRQLEEFLQRLFRRWPRAVLYCGLESTGGYENRWYDHLLAASVRWNLKVARLNPTAIKAHKKALTTQTETDPVTARAIASYLVTYPQNVRYAEGSDFRSLRQLVKLIHQLNQQKTRHVNQLEKMIYQYNPTLLLYWNNPLPKWWLKVAHRYPTTSHLRAASVKELCAIPYVTRAKAQELLGRARQARPVPFDPLVEVTIRTLVQQLLLLDKRIEDLKATLAEHVSKQPRLAPLFQLWLTYKGCSEYTAAALAVYFVNVHRFAKAKSTAAYFGVNPVYRESGDGNWGYHMSKKGNRIVKSLLYMISRSGVQSNPVLQAVFTSALRRGKSKSAALGICMNKTVRILYGMAKSGKPFDPELAFQHMGRHKQLDRSKQRAVERKRRYQGFDQTAPISMRQRKKREQVESQPASAQDQSSKDRDHRTCSPCESTPLGKHFEIDSLNPAKQTRPFA